MFVKKVKLSFVIFDHPVKIYQVHESEQSSGFNI